jgi:hypothetical protein
MDKTSPIDSTISNLGLWSIESVTDKFKLLFFGRLCRSNSSTTHKKLFHILISQIILEEDEIENTIYFQYFQAIYFPQRLKLTDEQFSTINLF